MPETPAESADLDPDESQPEASQPAESQPAAVRITTEQVAHLAHLARIALTAEEIDKLTGELGVIIDSIAKVSEVATADIPATSHPIPLTNVFRPDVIGDTLSQEEALSGAPEHDGSRFKVSAILGEEQ